MKPELKVGDRVRWLYTSNDILTCVRDECAEVIYVMADGPGGESAYMFKNLDHKGATEWVFWVVGEISPSLYECLT